MKKRGAKEIFAEVLLELSKHMGVDKITVRRIVEESGLSQQTFYNHFADKYDLILWIHRSEGDRLIEKLGKDGYGYRELVRDNLTYYIAHKDFMRNVMENTYGNESYALQSAENAYRVWKDYICKRHGIPRLPQEVDFDLRLFCHANVRMTAEWAFTMPEIPAETFADYIFNAIPPKLCPYLSD